MKNMDKYFGRLEDCLYEAVELMDDVYNGDYRPDSLTTQPWRLLLEEITEYRWSTRVDTNESKGEI